MTDITQRAMLVSLNIKNWSANRKDPKVTKEVAEKHNADADAGNYTKRLLGKAALAEVREIASAARQEHYAQSLPWSDAGMRILPASNYFHYTDILTTWEEKYWRGVDGFILLYPTYRDQRKLSLGDMWNEDEYPPVSEVRDSFGWTRNIMPMPNEQDFRVELSQADVTRIQEDIRSRVLKEVQSASQELWMRLSESVEHMVERLTKYDQLGKDGQIVHSFRESMLTNMAGVIDLLPRLNVSGDDELDKIAKRMKTKLLKYDTDDLRKDQAVRQQVAADASEILDAMSGYITAN